MSLYCHLARDPFVRGSTLKKMHAEHDPRIRFATDCTGMDAARVCMQRILPDASLHYCFASDIESAPRRVIGAQRLTPDTICSDATAHRPDLPSVDIYMAGPPCQSFSGLSPHPRGFEDDRGRVMHAVLQYISTHLPTVFIIENVKALLSNDKGQTWASIMQTLHAIRAPGSSAPAYEVVHSVISPHHLGFAQSRARVFIVGRLVGVLGTKATAPFPWPQREPLLSRESLRDMLIPDTAVAALEPEALRECAPCALRGIRDINQRMTDRNIPLPSDDNPHVADVMVTAGRARHGIPGVACCQTTRSHKFYVFRGPSAGRYLTVSDSMRIQGYHRETDFSAESFVGIRRLAMYRLIGNSIHAGVLELLLRPCVEMVMAARQPCVET